MLLHSALRGSMGRVGAAGDNAAMESFYSLLQKNVLQPTALEDPRGPPHGHHYGGSRGPTTAGADKRAVGRLTPIEFETIYTAPSAVPFVPLF